MSAKAFEILIRENSRMLTTYLRSTVNDEVVVDDLYQETLLVAWKRLDECDRSRPFGPWLRGIASRLTMAYYRKKKSMPLVLDNVVLEHIDRQFESISSQAADTWEEKITALHDCIEALPESHQTAINGRYFDELQTASLATRLNISLEACKKRVSRARHMLADCLRRKNVLIDAAEAAS